MKVFWIFFYNLFLYPLFFTGACIGALFNKKLRKGIMGRWHTHSQLLLFKKKGFKKVTILNKEKKFITDLVCDITSHQLINDSFDLINHMASPSNEQTSNRVDALLGKLSEVNFR